MHITNQNLSVDIFTVINLLNIFMEHDFIILMIFGIKEKYPSDLRLRVCSRDTFLQMQVNVRLNHA